MTAPSSKRERERKLADDGLAALRLLAKFTKFCPKCGRVLDKESLGCFGTAWWCKFHGRVVR